MVQGILGYYGSRGIKVLGYVPDFRVQGVSMVKDYQRTRIQGVSGFNVLYQGLRSLKVQEVSWY